MSLKMEPIFHFAVQCNFFCIFAKRELRCSGTRKGSLGSLAAPRRIARPRTLSPVTHIDDHNKGGDMRHSTGGKRWRKVLGSGIGAACMSFAALAGGLAAPLAQAAELHFVLISHAPDSDSWWNTIKNAIKQADEDFGVQNDYRNPPNGDLADMARLIEQAAARNYNGVIVSIADFDVLKSSIGRVTAKHIPLVTINS